jgi:hypothetical protein
MNYKVDEVALSYPNISYKVDESASTESVYVTYTNNDPKYPENERPKVTVRYSNHDSNAVKFGDQLRGEAVERNNGELLYRLGLKEREWIPAPSVPTQTVSKKDLENGTYEESGLTERDIMLLPVGADIAEHKGKLIKGTNKLILVDKVLANNNRGYYRYSDIPEVEQQRAKQLVREIVEPFAKEKREEQEGETLFSKKELTPEQKKKQEALKENAKAIRKLHNMTSRFPITVLRNLGFALETQEQREMHDRLFAERDAITGESKPAGLQTNPQSMTLQERITESLLKQANKEKENIEMRLSAIRAYGRDLANVIKLMNAQKGYDRNTVRMFTDLVKMYLRNNAMSGMSSYDIARLMNLMQRATGGRENMVNQVAVKIAEIITGAHTKQLNGIMEKQIKTGKERVNTSGVVVQGGRECNSVEENSACRFLYPSFLLTLPSVRVRRANVLNFN